MTGTYSPDDNKLRLYASGRLDKELYLRVKAAGFGWAPKQELFVAPAWTPGREDLLIELCGEIGDEDTSLAERAVERADRFDDYSSKRADEAEGAREAVSRIADGIPFGQPILVGHHSERHARRDAEKIENGMRRAVKLWETSQYWQDRAKGAIRHAKYKERPDVRARRIKGIEADVRKMDRADKETEAQARLWALIDKPEGWKPREDGSTLTREERAAYIAGRVNAYVKLREDRSGYWSAYDVLRLPAEERYKDTPTMTVDEVLAAVARAEEAGKAGRQRWRQHYENRLSYERAMLADSGGTVVDRTGPAKGGACKCWAGPRGGWAYIQKVNKVTVTVLDNWGNGGRNFTRNIPFDKLAAIMTPDQVEEARTAGLLVETEDKTGFFLRATPGDDTKEETPAEHSDRLHREYMAKQEEDAKPGAFEAMKESLKAGVQVVSAPQLFPTPVELAEKMVALAHINPGNSVLEPSAGTGRLLGAMGGRMFGHNPERGSVVAVEINSGLAEGLRRSYPLTDVRCQDFLTCNSELGTFDRIVMNPPFGRGEDIEHIEKAVTMLNPGGRLVALCANGPRQEAKLRPMVEDVGGEWIELEEGTFKEAGTSVRVVLMVVDRPL